MLLCMARSRLARLLIFGYRIAEPRCPGEQLLRWRGVLLLLSTDQLPYCNPGRLDTLVRRAVRFSAGSLQFSRQRLAVFAMDSSHKRFQDRAFPRRRDLEKAAKNGIMRCVSEEENRA